MMKADVLSFLDEIKVCTAYKLKDGTLTQEMPFQLLDEEVEPVYETLPGWKKDLAKVKSYGDMPDQLKQYIEFIESKTNTPIKIVSVGPDRTQTVIR